MDQQASSREHCLARAAECELKAEQAETVDTKAIYLHLVRRWRALAANAVA
jgi:hypothetical protein